MTGPDSGPARRLIPGHSSTATADDHERGSTYDRWRTEHEAHAASILAPVVYPDGTPGTPLPLFDPADL
jgi:hypothetical protein